MKHAIAIFVVGLYYVIVNIWQLNPDSLFWTATIYIFVPIVFLPLLTYGAIGILQERRLISNHKTTLKSTGFNITHELPSVYLDSVNRRLAVVEVDSRGGGIRHWVLEFRDILGTAVVKDGQKVTSTSSASLLGRAIVGGIAMGGLGALLGGLTASSHTNRQIKKLVLEVVLNLPEHPVHRITFLDSQNGLPVDSSTVRAAAEEMELAQALLDIAMMGEDIPLAKSKKEIQDTLRMLQLRARRAEA